MFSQVQKKLENKNQLIWPTFKLKLKNSCSNFKNNLIRDFLQNYSGFFKKSYH